eukprot:UN27735
MEFIKTALDKGFMVMCSDFSLKALIARWEEKLLGPNPFKKVGQFGGAFTLRFEPDTLMDCPSAQLQKCGELCDKGSAKVDAMSSTIAYTVNRKKADNKSYAYQVLTIATGITVGSKNDMLPLGDHKGLAGHVLLKYPSGGQLLTSTGHWVELVKLDNISEERLFECVQTTWGTDYYDDMQ